MVLGIEHEDSYKLGKYPTNEATFPVHNSISCGSKLSVPATIVLLTISTANGNNKYKADFKKRETRERICSKSKCTLWYRS